MIDDDHIRRVLERLAQVETLCSDPAVTGDPRRFRELLREHAHLRRVREKIEPYLRLRKDVAGHREILDGPSTDTELRELARQELPALERAIGQAEGELLRALAPPDPDADRNAIVEIRAGTGGEEAALFAADLFRMYGRYAEARRLKTGLIDRSLSSAGGFKEVVFSVEGPQAYGRLRYESGVHRVQRVPSTEAQGRIHTSAATVAVFPEAAEEDDIDLAPDDVRVDIFCSSGPGGQSVNTTYSAVRVTHLPTGLVAQSQDERSQHRNKEKAMAVLKARILDRKRAEEQTRLGSSRRSMIGTGDRSERIRTYNFPQNRVTDHRIGLTLYTLDRVMEGDLDELLDALGERNRAGRMDAELGAAGRPERAG